MNVVNLVGRLGKDPVTRDAGTSKVCGTTMALAAYKKDDPPIWVDLSAWGKTGEILQQYAKKGSQIAVSGRLDKPRAWINNQNGEANCAIAITVEKLTLLGSKDDKESTSGSGDAYNVPKTAGTAKQTAPAGDDPF